MGGSVAAGHASLGSPTSHPTAPYASGQDCFHPAETPDRLLLMLLVNLCTYLDSKFIFMKIFYSTKRSLCQCPSYFFPAYI